MIPSELSIWLAICRSRAEGLAKSRKMAEAVLEGREAFNKQSASGEEKTQIEGKIAAEETAEVSK